MRHETMKHYSHKSDRRDNLDKYGNYLLETDTTRIYIYIGNKLNFGSCVSLSSIYQFIVRLSSAWQCRLTFLSTPTTIYYVNTLQANIKYTHGIKSNSYIFRVSNDNNGRHS